MKNTRPAHFLDTNPEHHSNVLREGYIKSFSQRTGEQAGHLVADFLAGILSLLLGDKSPGSERSRADPPSSKLSPSVPAESEMLLNAYEIAVILNISKAKAYRLISRREITSIRFGRTTRVRKQDLENFLNTHTVQEL